MQYVNTHKAIQDFEYSVLCFKSVQNYKRKHTNASLYNQTVEV